MPSSSRSARKIWRTGGLRLPLRSRSRKNEPRGVFVQATLANILCAAVTDTNPKCKRGRHSHPRLRFGLVCSGRKCVSFGRAEYRKRNPRSWSRLNGVESQPTPGDSMPERQPRRINDLDKATRLAGHERDLQSRIPHASTVRASWIRPSACGAGRTMIAEAAPHRDHPNRRSPTNPARLASRAPGFFRARRRVTCSHDLDVRLFIKPDFSS